MNVKLNQLEEEIRKSKCAICGLLLSVGPLMVMSEDGSQIRCGRCKEIECQQLVRNILYENISEALAFPCSYEKCKEGIPWGQVEEHEKVCPFRTIYCPLYYLGCNDRIFEVADLQSHFNQDHKGHLELGNVEHKLGIEDNTVHLLEVDNLEFLVYLLSSTNFFFIVFSLDPLDKFTKYNVKIRSDKNGILVSYPKQKIIQFNEKEHCYKCYMDECTLKCHPYSLANMNPASFDWQTISHKFDKSLIELLDKPEYLIITIDLIADQKEQDSTTTTSCQCLKNEDERKEAAVDKKYEKIEVPC